MFFDKRFLIIIAFFAVYLYLRLRGSDFYVGYYSLTQLVLLGLVFLIAGISMLFIFDWIMLSILKRKVKKVLQQNEKIDFSKKVFFYLHTPDGKSFSNPISPFEGLDPGGRISSAGLFLTSRNRIILIGDRTKNNFATSAEFITLLDLTKDEVKKVSIEDRMIDTGGLPSPGIVLKIHTTDSKEYELGVGGIGFSKIFDIIHLYTYDEARRKIKNPLIQFFGIKIQ